MSKLSNYLLKRRKELQLTQIQVAKEIKTSDRAISQHENGKRRPRLEKMMMYSKLYRVPIHKLYDLAIEDVKEMKKNE